MRRFFIDPSEISKDKPVIGGQEAHHITAVFRLKPNDQIILVDGSGFEYKARIINAGKHQVVVAVLERYAAHTESPIKITVGQGYLKDKKMDMLIRHLTEIGITRWTPMITEYSVPQPDKKRNDPRIQRWEVIAREAVKQCGRTLTPEITSPLSFDEAVAGSSDMDLKIIFYENENLPFIQTMPKADSRPVEIMALFGPEGGFSKKEVERALASGFVTASLGPRIMRAETASIAACTLIQHIFGDMR
ncbi:MAG: 16S rRNA (uracil(1498)-N(3))-methyltransferase [Desulfosalsimonadaceae bacterium]|nr:16S rRNA (uracil(1498)-N(3))-methyltransferase [Desulfosalsimonadaceae bacterium]